MDAKAQAGIRLGRIRIDIETCERCKGQVKIIIEVPERCAEEPLHLSASSHRENTGPSINLSPPQNCLP